MGPQYVGKCTGHLHGVAVRPAAPHSGRVNSSPWRDRERRVTRTRQSGYFLALDRDSDRLVEMVKVVAYAPAVHGRETGFCWCFVLVSCGASFRGRSGRCSAASGGG